MALELEGVFGELGISQYLDSFIEQGFDTWETILDITESDLDALGVKLGHRRKLQRRIANTRAQALGPSLVSPTRLSSEGARPEPQRSGLGRDDGKEVAVVTKRKYRRHPKPDENAPERPPSAYVLFSNKMRDDLKGRNLTFTEIAKLVGENWQSLSPADKEPFETAALKQKEKYNHDMAEYKKTSEYRKYCRYLQEFKQKQAHQNQAKDASKRLKLETAARLHHGSSSSATPASASGTASGTASGSDSQAGSEPPPTRKRRIGSTVSVTESQLSSTAPTIVSHQSPVDEPMHSPPPHAEQDAERSPILTSSGTNGLLSRGQRPRSWREGRANGEAAAPPHLPSLQDMLSDGRIVNGVSQSPDRTGFGAFGPAGLPMGPPPMLTHEHSSAGSVGSSNSSYNYPRTPSEPSLPIHALLQNKGAQMATPYEPQHSPFFNGQPALSDQKAGSNLPGFAPRGNGDDARLPRSHEARLMSVSGFPSPPSLPKFPSPGAGPETDGPVARPRAPPAGAPVKDDTGLDGMSALLKAGEIVGRRVQ